MNQLETLIIPTETVNFGNQSFEVRGLALAHIIAIVRQRRDVLTDLYDRATTGKLEGSTEEIAMRLAEDFLPLSSLVIACGSGSPDSADKAAQLPFAVQIDAIEKIVALTLIAEGGLEKLMETVIRVLAGMANLTSRQT